MLHGDLDHSYRLVTMLLTDSQSINLTDRQVDRQSINQNDRQQTDTGEFRFLDPIFLVQGIKMFFAFTTVRRKNTIDSFISFFKKKKTELRAVEYIYKLFALILLIIINLLILFQAFIC